MSRVVQTVKPWGRGCKVNTCSPKVGNVEWIFGDNTVASHGHSILVQKALLLLSGQAKRVKLLDERTWAGIFASVTNIRSGINIRHWLLAWERVRQGDQ